MKTKWTTLALGALVTMFIGILVGRWTVEPHTTEDAELVVTEENDEEESVELCDTLCCNMAQYNEMSLPDLKRYACIYRDRDWPLTSRRYSDPEYTGAKDYMPSEVYSDMTESPGYGNVDGGPYDARYMDFPLDELSNYLCRIKTSDEYLNQNGGGVSEYAPNTIRFYYIKYPRNFTEGDSYNSSYVNRHSLAALPVHVVRENNAVVGQREIYELHHAGSLTTTSAIYSIANHNIICPPFTGCYTDPEHPTVLEQIDEEGMCVPKVIKLEGGGAVKSQTGQAQP